jgi:tetratricopeptide (TPR) repeat protein
MRTAGVQLKAHGHLKESTEMFEKSLLWLRQRYEEEPPSDVMTYQLATALFFAENFTGAAELLKDLHERNPEDLDYLGFLGTAEARRGNSEEARRIFEKIEAWNEPYLYGNDTARLAFIAGALGEKDKAVSLLRNALSRGFSYASLYQNMFLEPLWDHPAFNELMKTKQNPLKH